MPRVALGFALSPLASGVLQAALMGNAGALVVVVFSYPCALLLGIPAFVAARRLGWLSLWAVIVTGAALGLFAGIVINYLAGAGFGDYSAWSMILGLLLFAAHGAAVAGLFWLIALWRWHDDRRDSAS